MNNLKIVAHEAKNVLRLKAFSVKLDDKGQLIIIGGENAQGKTSALDSIFLGLVGGKSIPPDPVHHGAACATTKTTLSNGLTVERTIYPDRNQKVVVKDASGGKYAAGQTVIDALLGKLTFDPLAFARAEPKKQVEIMERLCGIDSEALGRQRRALYDERTLVGRERDAAKARYDSATYYPEVTEGADVSSLIRDLNEARAVNQANADKRRDLMALEGNAESIRRQIKELEAQLQAVEGRVEQRREECRQLRDFDTSVIEAKIAEAGQINEKQRANEEYGKLAQAWSDAGERYDKLSRDIDAIDAMKSRAVAEAKLPLDGLSFGEDGLLYNGAPFSDQASSAEKVKVSVAIAIALNPTLRVALAREGAFLDQSSMKVLAEMAEEHDFQIWLERVGSSEDCSIVIEDGEVLEDRISGEVAA